MRFAIILAALSSIGAAGPAAAVSLGLFSTSDCSSCNLQVPQGSPGVLYIAASDEGLPSNQFFSSAMFRVEGLPPSWSYAFVPAPYVVTSGDPFGPNGVQMGLASIQKGACIPLYTVVVLANSADPVRLRIAQLSNSDLPCPYVFIDCLFAPCDIIMCLGESELLINSELNCNVALQATSWTEVKSLFK